MGEALTLPPADRSAGEGRLPSGRLAFLLLGRFDLRRGGRGRLIHAVARRAVLGLLGLAARWCLLALADDHGYRLAHRHSVALAGDDLLEDAGVLGGELHRRLVGLDLGQDISDLHLVTLAFQPGAEGSRLHRIPHLGHDHLGHLYLSSR